MDTAVAWLQDEQSGPAKKMWLNIWEENNSEMQQLELQQQQQQNVAVTNPNSNMTSASSLDNTNSKPNSKVGDRSNQSSSSSPPPSATTPPNSASASTNTTAASATTPDKEGGVQAVGHNQQHSSNNGTQPVDRNVFNPTIRRKVEKNENKASTHNMNKYHQKLVGKYGGCPWREKSFNYGRGIIG